MVTLGRVGWTAKKGWIDSAVTRDTNLGKPVSTKACSGLLSNAPAHALEAFVTRFSAHTWYVRGYCCGVSGKTPCKRVRHTGYRDPRGKYTSRR